MARMFATLLPLPDGAGKEKTSFDIGELVCVEVPGNCTIHDADARRLIRVRVLANLISQQWREHRSVDTALLGELAQVSEELDG